MARQWARQSVGFLILLTLLLGIGSAINLARDVGRPFGDFLTFYNPIGWHWSIDAATPVWWAGMRQTGLDEKGRIWQIEDQYNRFTLDQPAIYADAFTQPAKEIAVQLRHDGSYFWITIPVTLFSWQHYFDVKLPDLIVGLCFWLLAFVVYRAAPNEAINQVFTVASSLVAMNRWLSRSALFLHTDFYSRLFDITNLIGLALLGPLLFHFALLFPTRSRFYRPWLLALVYSIAGLHIATTITSRTLLWQSGQTSLVSWLDHQGLHMFRVTVTVGIVAIFLRIIAAWFQANNRRQRHQNRLLALGLLISAPFIFSAWYSHLFASHTNIFWHAVDLRYLLLGFPMAIAFVILRYQTFRGIPPPAFLIIPLLAGSALAAEFLTLFWYNWQQAGDMALARTLFAPSFIVILMVSVFWASQSSWRGFLGRFLYRERQGYYSVRTFGQQVIKQRDTVRLPQKIAEALVSEMELKQAAVWLWQAESGCYEIAGAAGDWLADAGANSIKPEGVTIIDDSIIIYRLADKNSLPDWLRSLHSLPQAEIVIRLAAAHEQVGLLALGSRWDEEIIDERDLEIIKLIAQQSALFLLVGRQVEQLRQVPQHIAAAQEREQLRIAQELHDTIQQFLGGLPFFLELSRHAIDSNPDQADQILRRCVQDVEKAAQTVRQIRSHLAPVHLQDGLIAPVINLVRQFEMRTNISVRFEASPLCETLLDLDGRHALYRVVQQSLDNIATHARTATKVDVVLACSNSRLAFTIRDNGPGSTTKERNKRRMEGSFGLQSMEARIRSAGGVFQFSSYPQKGTELNGWIPVCSND